ncbi:MAG: hypothetical protein WA215_11930 [Candidatus Cybelea sp.]
MFAAFHLFVVLSFAISHGNWLRVLPEPIPSFLTSYGYLTGSSSGFSFFAPHVPDETMVDITVHRQASQYLFTLGSGNAERLRRVSSMLLQLDQEKGYFEGATLFASYVFAHDQAATRVDVRFYRHAVGALRTHDVLAPARQTVFVTSFARSRDYAR